MSMNKSKIGYFTIDDDGKPTHDYRAWNPFGMGCSGGCPGCWAKALSRRLSKKGCPDCLAFVPHIHPERLGDAGRRHQPSLVLCNFTNDWMDEGRPFNDVVRLMDAVRKAPQHGYVSLTQQAGRLKQALSDGWMMNSFYHGLTIRNQAEADVKLPDFFSIPGNLWISYEPVQGALQFRWASWAPLRGGNEWDGLRPLKGIIVGHDNRRGAPGTDTLDHIRSTVEQCKAAGVACFVKQIWMVHCPVCGTFRESEPPAGGCDCDDFPAKPILLRASHPDEYALYPAWAKGGKLPWPATPGGNA